MADNLVLGIIFALSGGLANSTGALLQKSAINKIPKSERDEDFLKKLLKSPSWLTGLVLILVASGVLITFAQFYIGAALIPGLMSVGMVVLTIGAVKLLSEKLKLSEYIGISLVIISVTIIGLSSLEITDDDMADLANTNFIIRFAIFSVILFILWITCRQLGKRLDKGKTIFLSLGSSFPFALANIWMQPFIFLFRELIKGNFSPLSIILFIVSIPIISVVNILGIIHVQDAFKHGNVSIVAPLQAIPQQIAPVILFYGIYLKISPQNYSIYLITAGITLILIAGFLLGRRQGLLETMDDVNEIKNP